MANKNEQVMVRLTEDDKEALLEIAEQRDVPVAQIIREAIREKLAETEKETAEVAGV